LYYDVIAPPSRRAPLLVALHGYGASKWHAMREAKMMLRKVSRSHRCRDRISICANRKKRRPLRFGFGWLTNYRPEESVAIHHRALIEMIEALTLEG